ncbi:hypothetical protein JCM33374_g1242 [Metschnikowia sp. JCM 33374]|nr:hypothetical protein JCM33374_g1242 [Metschnikowia sp. JCM 33374]
MSFAGPNRDKLVRATDLDALSCRLSANRKGYFVPSDKFIPALLTSYEQNLQYCEGYTQLSARRTIRSTFTEAKFPLINRGTYFRTESIDRIVSSFIEEHTGEGGVESDGRSDGGNLNNDKDKDSCKHTENDARSGSRRTCQIVALGGGSDTRSFRVLENHRARKDVVYTEIDFAESTKIKKIAISNSPALKSIIGPVLTGSEGPGTCDLAPIDVSSKEDMASLDPDLHCQQYHLVAADLRQLGAPGTNSFSFLQPEVPTLIISECVLCYVTPEENIRVLNFWKSMFSALAVVLYDPMGLGDAFGDTMAQNLSKRGLDMLTFSKYPDLQARKLLFEATLGFRAWLTDLASIGGYGVPSATWMDASESVRVSRLEMVDEVEEIGLLLKHYCLIYAESGMSSRLPTELKWIL